jgi:hypothetical protein
MNLRVRNRVAGDEVSARRLQRASRGLSAAPVKLTSSAADGEAMLFSDEWVIR